LADIGGNAKIAIVSADLAHAVGAGVEARRAAFLAAVIWREERTRTAFRAGQCIHALCASRSAAFAKTANIIFARLSVVSIRADVYALAFVIQKRPSLTLRAKL